MHHFYVIIDKDRDGELVYKTIDRPSFGLETYGASGVFPVWAFQYKGEEITVYGAALESSSVGENREEIEQRVLMALDLI